MKREVEVLGQECLDSTPNFIRSGPARSGMCACEGVSVSVREYEYKAEREKEETYS